MNDDNNVKRNWKCREKNGKRASRNSNGISGSDIDLWQSEIIIKTVLQSRSKLPNSPNARRHVQEEKCHARSNKAINISTSIKRENGLQNSNVFEYTHDFVELTTVRLFDATAKQQSRLKGVFITASRVVLFSWAT